LHNSWAYRGNLSWHFLNSYSMMKFGSLSLLEPSGPVKACNGIALPLLYLWYDEIWVAVLGSTSPTHLGLKLLALCATPIVPPLISRGAPRQATWETSVSEGGN
jgi:hypothetical protein